MQELQMNTMLSLGATELEDLEAPDFWGGFVVGLGAVMAAATAAAAIVALT